MQYYCQLTGSEIAPIFTGENARDTHFSGYGGFSDFWRR
jgi:hypothetical protein